MNLYEALEVLESVGAKVDLPEEGHFLIIGGYFGGVIGCTADRLSVLCEEPDATFQKVDRAECPVCNKERHGADEIA